MAQGPKHGSIKVSARHIIQKFTQGGFNSKLPLGAFWQDSASWGCWLEDTLGSVPHTSLHTADPTWQLASLRVMETATELEPVGNGLFWYPSHRRITPLLWPYSEGTHWV